MKKIILIPLDERPCNYYFPEALYSDCFELVLPPEDIMGFKKRPADFEKLKKWLFDNLEGVSGVIVAVDTLLYGGIIPSRLHHMSYEELTARLNIIDDIKRRGDITVYAFNLIMRCPQYSSSDEEPDYYGEFGEEIFLKGEVLHKKELGLLSDKKAASLVAGYDKKIRPADYEDFLCRRKINGKINLAVIDKLKNGVIDFLLIPQDDSAVYGHTAKDQVIVRQYIKENVLQDCAYMYPGADEIALTLLARMLNTFNKSRLKTFVHYSSNQGINNVPIFEDRSVGETIKYQLLASGCIQWFNPETADIILSVNVPSSRFREAADAGSSVEYDTERTLIEYCEQVEMFVNMNKPVIVADIAYGNGGDLELLAILNKKRLLTKIAGYAGWNTSSNTLGTCISQGIKYYYCGSTERHLDFLALRYAEDFGYCAYVRKYVKQNKLGAKYSSVNVGEARGEISRVVETEIRKFIDTKMDSIAKNIVIMDCYMPWIRMFEVGLRVKYKQGELI